MAGENQNTTNLNVVTGAKLEEALSGIWEAMKTYLTTHEDTTSLMTTVKAILDQANRAVIGTSGAQKANAIKTAVDSMVAAFTQAGIEMTGITTADFALCINALANNAGVYICDADGIRWTAAEWAQAREEAGGVDPAVREGILVNNPAHPFLVASHKMKNGVNETMQFGTYGHTIPNLQGFTGGLAGEPKDGRYNRRKILAATNPDALVRFGHTKTYFAGMTRADLTNIDVVFFPNESTLISWATGLGVQEMHAIGDVMIYAYPHASVANAYVLKYYANGASNITFTVREAQCPYTDNYSQIGSTPSNLCAAYKENTNDGNLWGCPTLYELFMIYINKDAINACLMAMNGAQSGESSLPSGGVWSCLQVNGNLEYYLSLADGSFNNGGKNGTYYCVPVAS